MRGTYVLSMLLIFASAQINSEDSETFTEEPVEVVDVNARLKAKLAEIREANSEEVSWFISRMAGSTSDPWARAGYVVTGTDRAHAKPMYGPHWVWKVQNLRALAVNYSIGQEETLPNRIVDSRTRKVFVHANCSPEPIPFTVAFTEQFREQTTWTWKKSIEKSWSVKLGFSLGGVPQGALGVSGDASSTKKISTDETDGTLRESTTTWNVNRQILLQAYTVSQIQVERQVRRLRVPFKASILADADVMVVPTKNMNPFIRYADLSQLLPSQSDRMFKVEGFIDDVSLGTEGFFVNSKKLDESLINDRTSCSNKSIEFWESVLGSTATNPPKGP